MNTCRSCLYARWNYREQCHECTYRMLHGLYPDFQENICKSFAKSQKRGRRKERNGNQNKG